MIPQDPAVVCIDELVFDEKGAIQRVKIAAAV